jgi:hypothetical protein
MATALATLHIRKVAHFHIIKIYELIFPHHYAAASASNSITDDRSGLWQYHSLSTSLSIYCDNFSSLRSIPTPT